jgi:hypothetical protein
MNNEDGKLEEDITQMLEYLMNGLSKSIVEKQKQKLNIKDNIKTKEDALKLIDAIYDVIYQIAGESHAKMVKERLLKEVENFE